jgi:thymidylate synthase (FAD)
MSIESYEDYVSVKIIGMTESFIKDNVTGQKLTPQEFVAYCARVSNPSNQMNNDTSENLLMYCIRNKHWSIFEMVNIACEIKTTRDISHQAIRHRSQNFQEFCVSGDTKIRFILPSVLKRDGNSSYTKEIEHLYNNWIKNSHTQNVIKNMHIRVYDEVNKCFTTSHISNIFKTGVKPVFKVTLTNEKTIKCTKEERFFTKNGFLPLEEIVGLTNNKNMWSMTNNCEVATNGIPVYQSYEWLKEAKEESIIKGFGVPYIAEKAGVSYHTIRKWLKINKLQFTKKEVAQYTQIWNKGKFGYSLPKHKQETIEKMRKSAKRGADSNLWKGGVERSERLKIADWCNANRSSFLIKYNYTCNKCNSNKKLHLHHIKPVYSHSELAYDFDNIEVLCKNCHYDVHNLNGDYKINKSKKSKLGIEWTTFKHIEYIGEEMTYDLEVEHNSHNYVANNILVHNSQRYADPTQLDSGFVVREARLQDKKNRQNSIDVEDDKLQEEWISRQLKQIDLAKENYDWAVANGIAKEQARVVLPEGLTKTTYYINGTLRSFIHYIQVRADPSTQKEHRIIANALLQNLQQYFPFLNRV